MSKTKQADKRGFWRRIRIYFRRFRIAAWSVLLILLLCLLGLNQIGLPDFIKNPILARLREQGVSLQFSRVRVRWEGIVAENVWFGQTRDADGPRLTSKEVQLKLNYIALCRGRLQVDWLRLRGGQLVWPVLDPTRPGRSITLYRVDAHLRFLPEDRWSLDNLHAELVGARLLMTGSLANAHAVTNLARLLSSPDPSRPPQTRALQDRLRLVADILEAVRFSAAPDLRLEVDGDARDLQSFNVALVVNAPGAETPWGQLADGHLSARLYPAGTNGISMAELRIDASHAYTPWASVTNFHLLGQATGRPAKTDLVEMGLVVESGSTHTPWVELGPSRMELEWMHSLTNPVPASGSLTVTCDRALTRWGQAGTARVTARVTKAGLPSAQQRVDLGPWRFLYPYHFDWRCRLQSLVSPEIETDELTLAGIWEAPTLVLTNLYSELYRGSLHAQARLNTETRRLAVSLKSEVDPHRLGPVLGREAKEWLGQFTWTEAPQLQGELSLILPAWTNATPDWKGQVLPTLQLAATADIPAAATFRDVPVSSASARIYYSNMCWHLPDLRLRRPEGSVQVEHRANERTRDFYWRFQSTVNPGIIRHLLGNEARKGFDLVALTAPPLLEAEIWGNSRARERLGFSGFVAASNFTFRGESVSSVHARLSYTNNVLEVLAPRLTRAEGEAIAEGLKADFTQNRVFLTNGYSTVEPMFIARAIGPAVVKAISPYRFETPPTARVHGIIPLHGEEGADLRFELHGGRFHWWRFNLDTLSGEVHWLGKSLTLRNLRAGFYTGEAAGYATFRFRDGGSADFDFGAAVTNALFQRVVAEFSTNSNQVEGRLSGTLAVTAANTEDWRTVQGYGEALLHDGVIWDIPLFGVFSPVFNSISPGLGQSRATSAMTTFTITNGVVLSRDLEVRSPQLRLQYNGTVDLEGNLNARAEAELLRDVWVVGPLVSTVFWPVSKLFQYKVVGTLSQPVMTPVTPVPGLMMLPFQPFRTLKGLFQENPSKTNAPPQGK